MNYSNSESAGGIYTRICHGMNEEVYLKMYWSDSDTRPEISGRGLP